MPNRDGRTLHIALSEFDFARVCDVAEAMETTPTQLAGAVIVTSVDQLAEQLEPDRAERGEAS